MVFFSLSVFLLESGLVLTASTVVLTDERISHVGDPHAVKTSCSHVELVDISSNALSDWHEVYINMRIYLFIILYVIYLDFSSSFVITSR